MHIMLRAGEKLYLNGAVLRADRKVGVELLNEAPFLLEAHVISVEKATTPLRQLYFIVQMMLMNPSDVAAATRLFDETLARMMNTYPAFRRDDAVLRCIESASRRLLSRRWFDGIAGAGSRLLTAR